MTMCWHAIYNIITIIILDAGIELGPLLDGKETKTGGPQIIPINSNVDGNTIPAVDVSNELNPNEVQTKEDNKVTKCEGPQSIPEKLPTAGNAITAFDTPIEPNLGKVQPKEGETLKSNNIDVKSDQPSIPSLADQQGLHVTVPRNGLWRSEGNITFNSHCYDFSQIW